MKRSPIKRRTTRPPRTTTPTDEPVWSLDESVPLIVQRSKGMCEYAGCHAPGQQNHHRFPRRMGGSRMWWIHAPCNLLRLCQHHHAYVESHRTEAVRDGLIVPLGGDPHEWAVECRHGRVWLLNSGAVTRKNPVTE